VAQFKVVRPQVYARFIDPRSSARTPKGQKASICVLLAKKGKVFLPGKAELDLKAAHDEMRLMLAGKQDPTGAGENGNYLQAPTMFYSTRCNNLIHQTANFALAADFKKGAWTGKASDKLSELFKDGVDVQSVSRRMIQRKPTYVPTKEVREEREQIKRQARRGPKRRDGILSGL
jgi:hypothetical protein